ncbi:MAG: YqgE/AlgH family protein, partial [Planctomycetaceae bacterium]|nr:YqgE/AlgH family protein [Planctomycetaceae bacterium]
FAIHSDEALYVMEISPGVYFSSAKETMDELVNNSKTQFRLFVGNAGWGEGQLAREIQEGSWYLAEATQQIVFADETSIWQELIEHVGRSIICDVLHTSNLPDDPLLN